MAHFVVAHRVGSRKLANTLALALEQYKKARLTEVAGLLGPDTPMTPSQPAQMAEAAANSIPAPIKPVEVEQRNQQGPKTAIHQTISSVKETPIPPTPPPILAVSVAQQRYLLVDDNNINLQVSNDGEHRHPSLLLPYVALYLVLIDFPNGQILESFMKKLGHAYKTATNGLESVEAYTSAATSTDGPFTHILMDISMPVMDGLEATRRIRQFERDEDAKRLQQQQTRRTGQQPAKIIALTGLASAAAQKEAFASGVDVYLTKPVRFKALAEVLKGV